MCGAQMVGPTPQPQGIPVTPEQAEQIQPENWAIHGQSTFTWLLQPAFRSPYQAAQRRCLLHILHHNGRLRRKSARVQPACGRVRDFAAEASDNVLEARTAHRCSSVLSGNQASEWNGGRKILWRRVIWVSV
jgi:hypothetical protein